MGIKVAFVTGPEEELGVKFLSAMLKKGGHDVGLFLDPLLFRDEMISVPALARRFDFGAELIAGLVRFKPDLIGFSVTTDFYSWAVESAGRIKKEAPGIPVIFGGVHPTTVPDEVIANECVDMLCVGEGEYPLLELADSLAAKIERLDIPNLWFKKDGRVIKNPLRALADIDALPYPDHGLYRGQPFISCGAFHTSVSRGCPFSCSYCCHSILKPLYGAANYYRVRSVANIVGEIGENTRRNSFKAIRFYDDIFPFELVWLREFSRAYAKEIGLPFICYLHPTVADDERLSLLRSAGCVEINLGIQTLNPVIRRDILRRPENNAAVERAISTVKKYGINVVTENIIGLPQQTEEDIIEAIAFYGRNRTTRNYFFWLRYYPGLPIAGFRDKSGQVPEGKNTYRVFTQGGDTKSRFKPNVILALYLSAWFPPRLVIPLIKNRIWKRLPGFSLLAFNLISNLASRAYSSRFIRRRALRKYCFFLIRFISGKCRRCK